LCAHWLKQCASSMHKRDTDGKLLSYDLDSLTHRLRNRRRKDGLASRSGETNTILILPRIISSKVAASLAVEVDPDNVTAGKRGGKTRI